VYLLVYVWSYGSIADLLPTTARLDAGYHRTLFSVASLLFMLTLGFGCLALQFGLLAARNADLAMVDWLTGLLNRRGFFHAVGQDPRLQPERVHSAGVIMLDIDNFKQLNDRLGHATGDRVLQALGERLRHLVESDQLVARIGGEEFCIVLPASSLTKSERLAEAIRLQCADIEVVSDGDAPVRFSVSAGVSEAAPQQSLQAAMAQADEALYAAKRQGRNQVVSWQPDVGPTRG
jgi:diguanylate cyclase (GGDEF)-like protein